MPVCAILPMIVARIGPVAEGHEGFRGFRKHAAPFSRGNDDGFHRWRSNSLRYILMPSLGKQLFHDRDHALGCVSVEHIKVSLA